MSPENPSPKRSASGTPLDSGSQALAEALRGSFAIVKFVMGVLLAVFLFSGFFTVGPQEKGIVLRFGRPVGEGDNAWLGPGPHWAWPYPIDEVIKVPVSELQEVRSTVGWYHQTAAEAAMNTPPPNTPSLSPVTDGYVITGDENIVHAKAILRYRIIDPSRCVFEFTGNTNGGFGLAGVSNAVQNALNNALVYTTAHYSVDNMLTYEKAKFNEDVQRRVNELVARENLGVAVDQCDVESIEPGALKDAFEKVTGATQDRNKLLLAAHQSAFATLSTAAAEAASITNRAESSRSNLVASISGDADLFQRVLPRYQANRDLFIQQRSVETIGHILTNLNDKIFLPTTRDGKPIELRLLLNRKPPKSKTTTGQ